MSRLRRSQNQEINALNPIALGSLVITNVIPLDLEQADKDFVSDEFNWLFYATHNFQALYQTYQTRTQHELSAPEQEALKKGYQQEFLATIPRSQIAKWSSQAVADSERRLEQYVAEAKRKIWQETVAGHEPVGWPIPAEAARLAGANNQALSTSKTHYRLAQFEAILYKKAPFQAEIELLKIGLKNLNANLDQATSLADTAPINQQVQVGISQSRLNMVETLEDIAQELADIYGITLSAPTQLLELLAGEL